MEDLNKENFIKKVFDFDKNQEWKFEGDKACIIDFYADWCQPCKMLSPVLEELSEEYKGQVDFYKIDTEKEKELAAAFGIQSIPTILFCPKEGDPRIAQGFAPKENLKEAINDILLAVK